MLSAEQLSELPEEEQAEYLALLEAQHDVESLDDFIARVSPRFPSPAHVKPVRDAFERSRHGPINVLLSMPPRHAKTFTIQHALAWMICNDPALSHAYVTYGQRPSERKSAEIQRYALTGGAQLATTAVDDWSTPEGGGLIATSIGGPYTGLGTTGVQVIDDPYKDPKDAESEAWGARVDDWYDGVARHRVQPGGSRIILHTRWVKNDLIGRMLREEPHKWEYINLPAVYDFEEDAADAALRALKDGKEPDYAAIGRALWPEYWPIRELVDKMAVKYFWWSQFMGDPRMRGEQLFDDPARLSLAEFKLAGKRACIVVDPATTAKTRADHSVIGVFAMDGYGIDATMYVLKIIRLQVQTPVLVQRIRDIQLRWRLPVVIEAVGGFKGVPQTLQSIDRSMVIHEIQPDQDKYLRAQPVSAAWNLGRVLVPNDADWVAEYLEELQAFTGINDSADDQVDVTAHAWNTLYRDRPRQAMGSRRAQGMPFG